MRLSSTSSIGNSFDAALELDSSSNCLDPRAETSAKNPSPVSSRGGRPCSAICWRYKQNTIPRSAAGFGMRSPLRHVHQPRIASLSAAIIARQLRSTREAALANHRIETNLGFELYDNR